MINEEQLTQLKQLEANSIHIMRGVIEDFQNPMMFYSVGKYSSFMLHLLQKIFYPARLPLPLVYVETKWKFKEMIGFQDHRDKKVGRELIVYSSPEGKADVSPRLAPTMEWDTAAAYDSVREC